MRLDPDRQKCVAVESVFMNRKHVLASIALAPILAVVAHSAQGQTKITTSTTAPVATATVNNGAPGDLDITSTGSVNPTAPGTAVTVNSSNVLTSEGQITFSGVSNSTAILVQGGNTGSVKVTGAITNSETYTPTTDTNTGIAFGAFAQGTARAGILVQGAAPFSGSITSTGTITVRGTNSLGLSVQAPVTGDVSMISVTPAATAGGTPTVARGSISVLGDHSVGLQVTPTGGVGGNVNIAAVSATGVGATAVAINGAVGGTVDFSGALTSTAYRSTSRPTNPAIAAFFRADQLQQGGSAAIIGANVGGGVIISAPPSPLSTTNLDLDANGIPDLVQGTGSLTTYGSAPTLVIGSATTGITLGSVPNSTINPSGAGLVIQGSVASNGLYDQVTTTNLAAPASATAIQVGIAGSGQTTTIAGGIHNLGTVIAQSYQADATSLHLASGAVTPLIANDGILVATSTQESTSTTGTPLNVTALLIEPGASVSSITNRNSITANITGTGGVGGAAGAIIDKSGSVTSVTNTGTINAILTQTLDTAPMPGSATAINLAAGTSAQTVTQSPSTAFTGVAAYSATTAYTVGTEVTLNGIVYKTVAATRAGLDPVNSPGLWRQVGATTPSINGSIYFGSGGSTFNVLGGTVTGAVIDLGSGTNSLTVNGDVNTVVTGAIRDAGGQLTLNVQNGTLKDFNPNPISVNSVTVGANGTLLVAADPLNGTNTDFIAHGASSFAQGAQLGLTLRSVQIATTQTYVVLQTVPGSGTLTSGTFPGAALTDAPYLYSATASYVPSASPATSPSEILLTVQRKSAAQLGLNREENSALTAVLTALPNDANIQASVLSQTTLPGFRAVYNQLLPNQGQGLFEALAGAAQSVSSLTSLSPSQGSRVTGTNLWLQEVNQRVNRSGITSQGSAAKALGLIAGVERTGRGGGAAGITFAYFNDQEQNFYAPVGGHVAASMVELGTYYRRAIGGLQLSARAAGGYSWFSGERRFVTSTIAETAFSRWNGYFVDAHLGAAHETRLGRYFVRPELSVDYLGLHEGSSQESGATSGFNLAIASRSSSRLSGQAIVSLGQQWGGPANWFRAEIRGGYRDVFAGQIGDTVANFTSGSPFVLTPDNSKGGWATFGLSLKGGSPFSYIALEGDADMRVGEYGYNIRVAGRSLF